MNFGLYSHPENTEATRAFELVKKGKTEKALKIIAAEGYANPERQVQLIEGFLAHMANSNKPKVSDVGKCIDGHVPNPE